MELKLKFEVQAKIRRPVSDVFDAVYDPKNSAAISQQAGRVALSMKEKK